MACLRVAKAYFKYENGFYNTRYNHSALEGLIVVNFGQL